MGIALDALLGQKWGDKFWLSLGGVLVVRVLVDLAFAVKDAKQELATDEHRKHGCLSRVFGVHL